MNIIEDGRIGPDGIVYGLEKFHRIPTDIITLYSK